MKRLFILFVFGLVCISVLSCKKDSDSSCCLIEVIVGYSVVMDDSHSFYAETNLTNNNYFPYGTLQNKLFTNTSGNKYSCVIYRYSSYTPDKVINSYESFLEWISETVPDPFIDICMYRRDKVGRQFVSHLKKNLEDFNNTKMYHQPSSVHDYFIVFELDCTKEVQELLDSVSTGESPQ